MLTWICQFFQWKTGAGNHNKEKIEMGLGFVQKRLGNGMGITSPFQVLRRN